MVVVYWIRKNNHTDPRAEGYVGVTTNLTKRIQEHKREKWFCKEYYVVDILQTFDLEADAYLFEEQMRPTSNIGWNINKGGIKPPVNNRKGVPLPLWAADKKQRHSIRMKECYREGIIKHWTNNYSKEEVSKRISKGDPGKSRRGKEALNRTSVREITSNKIFNSQTEAADYLKIRQGDIANCLSGRQKSAKGFQFEYVD
jgi:predicted GIY-YIG superfamily endonuclease